MKFFASLKGIDLDKGAATSAEEQVQRVKDRVAARMKGENPEKYELETYLGIEYEEE